MPAGSMPFLHLRGNPCHLPGVTICITDRLTENYKSVYLSVCLSVCNLDPRFLECIDEDRYQVDEKSIDDREE